MLIFAARTVHRRNLHRHFHFFASGRGTGISEKSPGNTTLHGTHMQYLALASDYDGTLAHDGHVDEDTLAAVRALRASRRKFVLVTGRELPELKHVFPDLALCDLVVAENGGLLYWPEAGIEHPLGEPIGDEFLSAVRHRGVAPFSVGKVIFAAWRPHETAVLECIQELGLDYQIIFNKDAVMVLPSGVNKATGLAYALDLLGITADEVIAVGDAENDLAFFKMCGFACAVDNALPSVKETSDMVTAAHHGAGVAELIKRLLRDDLPPPKPR